MDKRTLEVAKRKVEAYNDLWLEREEFDGFKAERVALDKKLRKAEREMVKYLREHGELVFNASGAAGDLCISWEEFLEWEV